MKLSYEFKQGDWVNCSNRTEEEVQAILDRMWELGANHFEDISNFDLDFSESLSWYRDGDTYFIDGECYKDDPDYNEVLWEDILPTISTEDLDEISKIDQEQGLYEETPETPPVTEWKCFEQVAKVLGEEDAEYELNLVRLKGLDDKSFNIYTERPINISFDWRSAPQGRDFWDCIHREVLPQSYIKQEESTKTSSQTLGELVELIQCKILTTPLNVSVSPEGVFLHGEGFPTVDVTKLNSGVVDKLVEVLTEVKGCFVEFNEEG